MQKYRQRHTRQLPQQQSMTRTADNATMEHEADPRCHQRRATAHCSSGSTVLALSWMRMGWWRVSGTSTRFLEPELPPIDSRLSTGSASASRTRIGASYSPQHFIR
eukprot:5356424-Amphidinium_carterae.2